MEHSILRSYSSNLLFYPPSPLFLEGYFFFQIYYKGDISIYGSQITEFPFLRMSNAPLKTFTRLSNFHASFKRKLVFNIGEGV